MGKSRILQAVGHAACVQGYRVRYATSAKVLQEFTAVLADGTFSRMLGESARFDLLLIDEFGFDRLECEAGPTRGLRFRVAGPRRITRPRVASRAPWPSFFNDPTNG